MVYLEILSTSEQPAIYQHCFFTSPSFRFQTSSVDLPVLITMQVSLYSSTRACRSFTARWMHFLLAIMGYRSRSASRRGVAYSVPVPIFYLRLNKGVKRMNLELSVFNSLPSEGYLDGQELFTVLGVSLLVNLWSIHYNSTKLELVDCNPFLYQFDYQHSLVLRQ